MTYSVLIVEDQEPVAQRLCQAVIDHPKLDLFGVAPTLAQARILIESGEPNVLLVDIGLPDGNGTALIREIYQRGYRTEAMVITVFGDERHIVSALAAGATGYLLKDERMDRIAESIMQLIRGESPMSPSIARYLLNRFISIEKSATVKISTGICLTVKEQEVLHYIAKGFTGAEIAQLMNVSPHTVMTHTKHIYQKLAVHSRTEAVYEATQRGIIAMSEP